jgi:hypothetical protein
MVKDDERQLFRAVKEETRLLRSDPNHEYKAPRYVARELGIPVNRACYLCFKWADKDWYDYGVCIDMGWLEPLGMVQEL